MYDTRLKTKENDNYSDMHITFCGKNKEIIHCKICNGGFDGKGKTTKEKCALIKTGLQQLLVGQLPTPC